MKLPNPKDQTLYALLDKKNNVRICWIPDIELLRIAQQNNPDHYIVSLKVETLPPIKEEPPTLSE